MILGRLFITFAKISKINDSAIKCIVGHQLDIIERVYTERPLSWLQKEISKLVFKRCTNGMHSIQTNIQTLYKQSTFYSDDVLLTAGRNAYFKRH